MEMSDEEKKAIERLNKRYDFFKENPLATNVWLTLDIHNLGIVLNLIEKKSKEMEEYKKQLDLDNECEIALNSKVMDLEKKNRRIEKCRFNNSISEWIL